MKKSPFQMSYKYNYVLYICDYYIIRINSLYIPFMIFKYIHITKLTADLLEDIAEVITQRISLDRLITSHEPN